MAEICNDPNCFKHGSLKVRGGRLEGKVVSDKGKRTVIVERDITKRLTKYKRYAKEKSRTPAHKPDCMEVSVGDIVAIGETRKISKTKAWTVLEVVKKAEKQ